MLPQCKSMLGPRLSFGARAQPEDSHGPKHRTNRNEVIRPTIEEASPKLVSMAK